MVIWPRSVPGLWGPPVSPAGPRLGPPGPDAEPIKQAFRFFRFTALGCAGREYFLIEDPSERDSTN